MKKREKKVEEKETNLSNEIWNYERNGANAIQVRSEDNREGKSSMEKLARW